MLSSAASQQTQDVLIQLTSPREAADSMKTPTPSVEQNEASTVLSRASAPANPPLRVTHPRFNGTALFKTFKEAALCLLLMDGVPVMSFVEWAAEMKQRINATPACVPRNEFWRYHLLHDPSLPLGVKVEEPPQSCCDSTCKIDLTNATPATATTTTGAQPQQQSQAPALQRPSQGVCQHDSSTDEGSLTAEEDQSDHSATKVSKRKRKMETKAETEPQVVRRRVCNR
eukprot:Gregarina_sp_Pseudo_9__3848@NODE_39_length_5284_cov_104_254719_g36_i0_p4_GENE_NODE_39_length_5284_cov_104_254719_g36_i0NODE_39_length_5284_cov_104_254719_g36_i0_p4_ORF_typecomplete_len228_score35_54_NODE_39_length_5284_cov_104_254719_g36_i023463029